jgi:AraC-like DNA-binding protein
MADFFNDIEVLWISRFNYKSDWILAPHAHKEFCQLIYCIDGSCSLLLDNQSYQISAPAVLFFPPNTKHGIINITTTGLKTLDTKFKIRSRKLLKYCRRLPYILTVPSNEIYNKLEAIHKNGIIRDALYEEYCQLILGQILIELMRETGGERLTEKPIPGFSEDPELSPLVSKVMEYIKTHYQERINTVVLEQEMFFSYRYLSKHFYNEMKMTPIQFAEKYKVYKAKELLRNTEFAIKYISEILGYSNVHEFSRSFKKNVGIPPARWRDTAWSDICKDVVIHSGFENTLFIKKLTS